MDLLSAERAVVLEWVGWYPPLLPQDWQCQYTVGGRRAAHSPGPAETLKAGWCCDSEPGSRGQGGVAFLAPGPQEGAVPLLRILIPG